MIQDIFPSRLKNEYINTVISDTDTLVAFNAEGKILLGKRDDGRIVFPSGSDLAGDTAIYLFSVDDTRYFLAPGSSLEKEGFDHYSIRDVRDRFEGKEVYAVFTAYHLWRWYSDNVFCGRCAGKLVPDEKERALRCPECGNMIYPRINPAVIVGVKNGDRLLITRYRTGYSNNALVAGFTEIGETLEETVAREVMEETGIRVKNIQYYKSQPWGMAQDILTGFYCEADGDTQIKMDENELKYAEWVKREDIVLQPNNLSLTNEMMRMFKEGREPLSDRAPATVRSLQLKNDDYLGHVEHIRHACRGILVKDGKVLLSYEANNGKYIIPGGGVEEGETYAECCEREMLEETGMKVRAVKCYLDIEEMFLDWDHINHYFVCEFVEDTGEKHLTEAEERAGCCCAWKELSEALDIFGRYEDYHKNDIAVYGLYRREYTALKEYEALIKA